MILDGIASALTEDIEDWYLSRGEAESTLAGILNDERDFEGDVWIEAMQFETNPN
jgi:hypothetical protein